MAVVALALASSLCYGVADFLGGLVSRKTSALNAAAAAQAIGLAALVPAFLFVHGRLRGEDLIWGALSGFAYAAGIVFFYTGLARSRMAVVSPITAVVGASVPVLFGYIAGERPSILANVGVGLAFVAVALLSANAEKACLTIRDAGVAPAVGSGVGFGLSLLFLSRSSHETGLWALLAGSLASMLVLGVWSVRDATRFRPDRKTIGLLFAAGVLGTWGGVSLVLALRAGVLPVVAVLVSLYPAGTILLACFFLHERLSFIQWIGILCALSGTAFIARASA